MSVSVNFLTVTNAISNLSIAGVNISDVTDFKLSALREVPLLAPYPTNFVSDFESEADELTKQKLTIRYTLNYRYYHCPIDNTFRATAYADAIGKISSILLALLQNHIIAGALDTNLPAVSGIGPTVDPQGDNFLGCLISLRISQFVETS